MDTPEGVSNVANFITDSHFLINSVFFVSNSFLTFKVNGHVLEGKRYNVEIFIFHDGFISFKERMCSLRMPILSDKRSSQF